MPDFDCGGGATEGSKCNNIVSPICFVSLRVQVSFDEGDGNSEKLCCDNSEKSKADFYRLHTCFQIMLVKLSTIRIIASYKLIGMVVICIVMCQESNQ